MNIRKPVDYGTMYRELTAILTQNLPQMDEVYAIGKAISQRSEKGAAVAAAEFLQANFPDRTGFSPRNVRRMRDFYRTYENDQTLLRLAMKIGWTLNVVIMEAELTREQRISCLRKVASKKLSKNELLEIILNGAFVEETVDESTEICYNITSKIRITALGLRKVIDISYMHNRTVCLLPLWRVTMKKEFPKKNNEIKGAIAIGMWKNEEAPVFSVSTQHELNQLVGYVKHINAANGTVLYRGQTDDYQELKPSGCRGHGHVPDSIIHKLINDKKFQHYLGLNQLEVTGWKKYQELLTEAVLQHYGANTRCMDFVDNHWCALWFGLYRFDPVSHRYVKRTDQDGVMYIYLYLADTNCPSINGVYIGEDAYTVDLRKALPSHFLRPASQHGWIVRDKNASANSDYGENVLCVISMKIRDVANWLGDGLLLTQDNFFPDYNVDDGYKALLSRQERSGIYKQSGKILPQDTIQNYHYYKGFYCSEDRGFKIAPQKVFFSEKTEITSIITLYEILLKRGWTEESCFNKKWSIENPCVGQSPATAVLVQRIFGGDILRYSWRSRQHYFNRINGIDIDLTSQERIDNPFNKYSECSRKGLPPKNETRILEKASTLLKEAKISERGEPNVP